ncbi:hypothetical protein [Terracidiphilus sp.]|jgi:hypothetical protein
MTTAMRPVGATAMLVIFGVFCLDRQTSGIQRFGHLNDEIETL